MEIKKSDSHILDVSGEVPFKWTSPLPLLAEYLANGRK